MYELISITDDSFYIQSPAKIGLVMTFEQYALMGSTVRSYLTWLKGRGLLQVIFENNELLWKAQNI